MKKILIAGAGGAPSEGVIRSLQQGCADDEVIGMGSEPFDLVLSAAHRKYSIPYSYEPTYKAMLLRLLSKERPDLVHFQNDREIFEASILRSEILATGARLFMPPHETVDTCVDKYKSYSVWMREGVRVPRNLFIRDHHDLKKAFDTLVNQQGMLWLRFSTIGGGGKGALPTSDYEFAKGWIDRCQGWGQFTAAEMLTADTVTWLSIWHEGELVVAQSRRRIGWVHGNRSVSGVTGVTKVGETCRSDTVDRVALDAIRTIDARPHGIFGVDMTYDSTGFPNPTEINISRFFTTILFFTEAGLNMPKIFADIALHGRFPVLARKMNPLPDGLLWCRGMDTKPRLMTRDQVERELLAP